MIQNYETKLLVYINSAVPTVNAAIYAERELLFEAFETVNKYPAFYFSRELEPWALTKSIDIREGITKLTMFPQLLNYKGVILLEKQSEALALVNTLRFYWKENPYLTIKWGDPEIDLTIALRLLYIKVEEIRNNKESKGPLRYVEFAWQSQLFFDKDVEVPTYTEIKITINNTIEIIK